jgi:hypothetical protein
MKIRVISLAAASLLNMPAWAESPSEWGYWDASGSNSQVPAAGFNAPQTGTTNAGPKTEGKRNDRAATVIDAGNLPNTLIRNIPLQAPERVPATPALPPINLADVLPVDKWFGFAALEYGTGADAGSYDDNAFLLVGSDWKYGTVPATDGKIMTFRIAGEDMPTVTRGTPTDYNTWDYNRDTSSTVTSNVHVNMQIPFPADVPMTIGHWHKGSQTYYTVVGSTTQVPDLQRLAAGPTLSYTGQSMGGSAVAMSVNFANSTWSGAWTPGQFPQAMSGSAASTPAFTANGTISGSSINSTAINGVAGLDAASSFVKGKFYGNGAAAVGGLTVIKTNTTQSSDLFVACKTGVTCAQRNLDY